MIKKTKASSGGHWISAEPLPLATVSARRSAEFREETGLYLDRQDPGHCAKKPEGEVDVCVCSDLLQMGNSSAFPALSRTLAAHGYSGHRLGWYSF